ncbi:beta-lactamase family protein [Acidaminobacter sp. JC074]|uniref:serine hydrolase domain-containing protein n=1 Tax=Acidaminobacter sp. JC074 TaxID=2530199 RepID=UPI001F0E077E|nr:beta-lactamase family protein [Acidaminobacter sp. JC074]MCH4891423.1 beta-lactamase family protein [Acidaminobacter sp. JC074]
MKEKKNIVRVLRMIMIPIGLLTLVLLPPWDGILTWLSPLPDTVQEQVSDATRRGLDGIIVYVDVEGRPPQTYTAGMKDRDNNIAANAHNLFKIASIAKLYDAVALTKMVGDEKLSLDDTLADFFPELVGKIENAEEITLRMMVRHRSGIPNFTDQDGYKWDNPPKTMEESLDLVFNLPASFDPDEDYEYSNTNYLLLAEIMNNVLGYDKFQYIEEEILNPLGLEDTYASLSDVAMDDVMSGYYVGLDNDFKDIDFGMLATAEDVGIFVRALNDGSLLTKDEQVIYDSLYEYGHKGWVLGYQSIAYYHSDIDAVVIQFVNTVSDETELTTQVIYDRIVKIIRNEIEVSK